MISERRAGVVAVDGVGKIAILQSTAAACQDEKLHFEEWILPKGHIENGETSIDAALREGAEEIGVIGEIITDKVCVVSHRELFVWPNATDPTKPTVTDKVIITAFYLMKVLDTFPNYEDDWRKMEWVTFEEAISKLAFPQHKHAVRTLFK